MIPSSESTAYSTRGAGHVEVRRASIEDLSAISSVLARAFADQRERYTDAGFRATTPTQDAMMLRLAEGPIWVAMQYEDIAGTVSAAPRGERLLVRGMGVLPEARGRGIGSGLLNEVQRFALAGGFASLVLSTTPFLTPAIRLYERFGFCRTEEGPHDLQGTPLLTMVKRLG